MQGSPWETKRPFLKTVFEAAHTRQLQNKTPQSFKTLPGKYCVVGGLHGINFATPEEDGVETERTERLHQHLRGQLPKNRSSNVSPVTSLRAYQHRPLPLCTHVAFPLARSTKQRPVAAIKFKSSFNNRRVIGPKNASLRLFLTPNL